MTQQDSAARNEIQRQEMVNANARALVLVSQLAGNIRSRISDYDRWTSLDSARLDDADINIFRNAMTRNGLEWRALIPQAMVRQWGDEAPAEFARQVQQIVGDRNLTPMLYDGMMRPILASAPAPNYTGDIQIPSLFRVGAGGRQADFTPGQVVNYSMTTEAAIVGGTTVDFPIAPSVQRVIADQNPDLARVLPPVVTGTANAAMIYEGATAAARGYVRPLDFPTLPPITDLNQLCSDIRNVEREIFNTTDNDVDTRTAIVAATARVQANCPRPTPPARPIPPTSLILQR